MPSSKSNRQGKGQKRSGKAVTKKAVKVSARASKKPAVTKSEQPIKLALEAARMGVWEYDIKTNEIKWSENVHKLFGLTKDAFDGTFETYINLIHQDDRKRVLKSIDQAIQKKGLHETEHRIVWPNGSVHWLETIGKVTVDKIGKPQTITGTIRDVSAKKTLEQERENWKTRHELIATSAGLVIYDYNIPTGDIVWSGNSELVLGYKPAELGNIDRWVSLIHPEDRDEAYALLEDAERDLKTFDVYYRFSKKDGNYCHMHDRGFFIPDKKGKAVRMLGMMQDVSERVNSERTIKDNILFRESIENAMPDILYVHDLKHQRNIYTNKNLGSQLGYSNSELAEMGDTFVEKIVHPDDMKNIYQWTNEKRGFIHESEMRVLEKNGTYRWFLTRDTPFSWDENGNVTHTIGIAQDITARKEAISQLNQSEHSYRELFDTVTEAIHLQEPDGTFVDLNKGACTLYGYEKSELIGKNPEFLSAEGKNDFEAIRHRMKQALKGKIQVFEFWGRKKKGEIFLQEIRLTKGSYFGKEIIIATGRDITQRRNTEEALRDSEQRFRTLQQASFGGIGLHDKGVIIDCNQGLCDLTGYTYSELIGFNGIQLIAPEWRAFVIEKIQSGYEKPYDVEGVRKDGSRYILEIHGKNIPYEGRPIRVTEFRDITDRKRSEEKIVEQNAKLLSLTEDLLRKNNQLEEFTQIVSHNLRSPVGNIVTLLNFFEGALSDAERKEYFNLLKESSATTLYMLNDLNEVLKIKQNKKVEMQELKFEHVLQQVKSMLNAKISQMSAAINFDFSKAPSIHYPIIYMESILLNLLDNALKYAHPNRTPEIYVKTEISPAGNIVLEVRDNGLGLNLDKYGHHIFKLRKTFHKHPESRGIGLFMIKNQIEAMGGEITITSKENEGSAFFINFSKTMSDAF